MGWNSSGRQSGSFTAAGDSSQWYTLNSISCSLASVNGECYEKSSGQRGSGNGGPIGVTFTVNGRSASATVTNSCGVTGGPIPDASQYPTGPNQSYTFTFNPGIEVDGGSTIGWSASWSGCLSCGGGGALNPSPNGTTRPKLVRVSRSVTLNANGGAFSDGATTKSASGTAMLMPGSSGPVTVNFSGLGTPSRADHKFIGWFDAATGGNQQTSTSVTLYSDVTYYAHWSTYLRFDLNGGEYSFPEYWNSVGDAMMLPSSIPIRNGYNFHSWYDDASKVAYAPGSTITFDRPRTLRARWVRRTVTAAVVTNMMHDVTPKYHTVKYGQSIQLIPERKQENYRFVGWDTDEHASGLKKNQTINCLWDLSDYFKYISGNWRRMFKANGNYVCYIYNGFVYNEFVLYKQDCLHPAITPFKEDCEFLGWTEDPNSLEYVDSLIMETEPLILYAVWKYKDVQIEIDKGRTFRPSGSNLIGFPVITVDYRRFDRLDCAFSSVFQNKPISEFNSSFFYLCITTKVFDGKICNPAVSALQTFTARKFIKSGSRIIDDSTMPGYNNKVVHTSFNIPNNLATYLTAVIGPDCEQVDMLQSTIIGHGRRITG